MDTEYKKLLAGGKWADEATDNVDPDSSSITPALVRTLGFPNTYSQQSGGNKPDRRRINQLLRELSGGAFEVRMGVSPYDSEVNYPINAITQVNGVLYRATAANGPLSTVVGPTDVGQTVWERVTGAIFKPEAPRLILFDNTTPNQMDVRWKAGRDGGSAIENYDIQWRIEGTHAENVWVPSTPIRYGYAQYTISPLTSGNKIQFRTRAIASTSQNPTQDEISPWATSVLDTSRNPSDVVRGAVPGGGDVLGLLATQSGSNARLTWKKPSDGGFPILRYIIQWRAPGDSFSANNQIITGTDLTYDVTGLSTGVEYSFQVAAENSQGRGAWSNIATLTLIATTTVQPTPTAASTSGESSAFTADARWSNHPTLATATPTSVGSWEWRESPSGPWQYPSYTGLTGLRVTGRTAGRAYDVRFTLVTPLGTTGYSPIATVNTLSGFSAPSAPGVTVTLSKNSTVLPGFDYNIFINWSYPSDDGGRGVFRYSIRLIWETNGNLPGGSRFASGSTNDRNTSFGIRTYPGTSITCMVQAYNGIWSPWGSVTRSLP